MTKKDFLQMSLVPKGDLIKAWGQRKKSCTGIVKSDSQAGRGLRTV